MSDQPRNDIPGLPAFEGTPEFDDLVHIIDVSAAHSQDRRMTWGQLMQILATFMLPQETELVPGPGWDETLNWQVGSRVLYTPGPTLYMCTDATENNAVWRVIVDWSGGGGGVS